MGRFCLACRHESVADIDAALLSGTSYRTIGAQFGLSASAICRHRPHIARTLAEAEKAKEASRADTLLAQLEALRAKALSILDRAEIAELTSKTSKDADRARRTSLTAIKEVRGHLELLARLLGELKTGTTVNVLISPQWVNLRTVILTAVEPFPEARTAIIEAVSRAED